MPRRSRNKSWLVNGKQLDCSPLSGAWTASAEPGGGAEGVPMNYVQHVSANVRNEKSSFKSFILFSVRKQKKNRVELRKNDKGTSRNDAAK